MSQYPKRHIKYEHEVMPEGIYEVIIIDTEWKQPRLKEGQTHTNNWMLVVKYAVTERGGFFNNKLASYFNLVHVSPETMKYSHISFEKLCKAIGIQPFEIDITTGPTRRDDEQLLHHHLKVKVTQSYANDGTISNFVRDTYSLSKSYESQYTTQPSSTPTQKTTTEESDFDDLNDKIPF